MLGTHGVLWLWVRGEMAPSVKCLRKHEDLSWDLQNPSILGLDRQRDTKIWGFLVNLSNLIGELQVWCETISKKKVEIN